MDLGTLVVVAGRALGQDAPAVLDMLDVGAAEAALAEAESPAAGDAPADRAAALLSALIRHRPLPRGNDRAAVLATVTFLAVNGWQVDLEPAEDTAAVLAGLAAGRRSAADLAAWLSPRISAYREPAVPPSPAKEAPMHGWLPNLRRSSRRKGDMMFRRFSPQAREVIISAQQEALALHHGFIGTEHLLLGLLRDRHGVAGRTLHALGVSPEAAREQVLDIVGGSQHELAGHIPLTPRSKKVLELAVQEAVRLGHLYVGTEHILLGLVREGDGVGWHVLHRLGLTVPRVRDQVLQLVRQDQQAPSHAIPPPGIRDYDTRIELARQAKDAAVDAKDLDRAAAARESEKELLAGRDRLIAQWSAGVDLPTLGRELDWLRDEVTRLQGLLVRHGIEPESAQQPGDPTQQSA
jgi:prophage maintenance system killer protein